MSVLKVVNVFQGASGLARDEFENVFHFVTPGGLLGNAQPGEAATAAARVANFYTGASAGGAQNIVGYLSEVIEFTATIKVYDMTPGEDPTPATLDTGSPILEVTYSLGGGGQAASLPPEVALCLSYYASINKPRHRGRLYIGPLNVGVLAPGPVPLPSPAFMTCLQTAGSRLVEAGTAAQSTAGLTPVLPATPVGAAIDGVNWILYSKLGTGTKVAPAPTYDLVTAGWIDNEWDGQSRRRIEATARVTFP